jgi:O-antigen ligase
VLGIIALAAAAVFDLSRLTAVPGLLLQALETGTTADGSVNIRLQFYSAGLEAFADSPIYGYGWWQRFIAIEPYLLTDTARAFSGPLGHLHNDLLNFATAAGVLGLLAYLLIIVAPAVSAWRSPRDSQWWFRIVAAISLGAGFFAFGFSDALFVVEVTRTVYILGAAAVLGFCRDEPLRLTPKA